ncbi:MAG TPA: membrane protein insertase YidC [Thermoanaerobaculia bacterium]|nr:membrane protein insertase YidC [Thermoanaerobaculia bacterium]
MDQKQLIIAALLSLLVLLGWSLLFPAPDPVRAPSVPVASEPAPGSPAAAAADGDSSGPAAAEAPGVPSDTRREPIAAAAEQRVEVSTDIVHTVFSNRGAQLLSYRIRDVKGRDGEPLEMVRQRAEGPYPFALTDAAGAPVALNDALFVVEGPESGGATGSRVVRFRHSGEAGTATKEFRFLRNGMLEVSIEVADQDGWGVMIGPGLRNPTAKELQSRNVLFRAASYLIGDSLEEHPAPKLREEIRVPGTGLRWAALEDTYFLSMLAPKTPVAGQILQPFLIVPGVDGAHPTFVPRPPPDQMTGALEDLPQEIRLVTTVNGARLDADAYWGAKRHRTLSELPGRYELSRTIRWGTFGILAKPMLLLLLWIHDHLVANFGWAIVLLTVLVKVVLMPLTHKSYVSMQKMSKLQPKIEAIKQKYRGKQRDKQGRPNLESQRKMNEEMQELFKTEGVNPAGGCLPLLLQMPVFFSFFSLLRNSVELWNTPWMLWIGDLSAPDPFYVLPIVMGGAQFLQQRMTPMTTANPAQRILLNTMPIWFTVISFGFASGLVLYWLTNNVLTILQQAIYQRLKKAGYLGGLDTSPPASAPAPRKERAERVKKK